MVDQKRDGQMDGQTNMKKGMCMCYGKLFHKVGSSPVKAVIYSECTSNGAQLDPFFPIWCMRKFPDFYANEHFHNLKLVMW